MFAITKIAASDSGGGNQASIAVDLLEFDQGMDKARKAHTRCIISMKAFWRSPSRKNFKAHAVEDMLSRLDEWDAAVTAALKEYNFLLEKYQNSPALLHAYASFCDTVLNDERQASKKREEASAFEKDEGMEEDKSGQDGGYAQSCGMSGGLSETDSKRMMSMHKIKSILPSVLGKEQALLKQLHR